MRMDRLVVAPVTISRLPDRSQREGQSNRMANTVSYIQLHTKSPDVAKSFYERVFEWKVAEPIGPSRYMEVSLPAGMSAGMLSAPLAETQGHWIPFIRVAGIENYVASAVALGGKILQRPTPLPNKGVYAFLADPTGAPFALFEPLT